MKKILGLVTCYNRKEKTIRAIRSLIEGNPEVEFEFIVADDASTDGTRQAVEQLGAVTVKVGNGQLFYSGGMRLAIAAAQERKQKYDYCLLFNDDVSFFDHSIERLIEKNSNVVWVGPTCDVNGQLTYGGVLQTSNWRPSYQTVMANCEEGMKCDTCNANCILIPWEIFQKVGNLDPVYVHSLGDYDYGFKMRSKGIEMRVSDQFVGECTSNSDKGTWKDVSLSRGVRLKLKESPKGLPRRDWFHYLKKNYGVFTAVLYSLIPYIRIVIGR